MIGEAGNDEKVKALVYVSAFAPDKGETLTKLLEGGQPSEGVKTIRLTEGGLILDPATFPQFFAGDVPVAEAEAMAAHQLPSNPANFDAVTEVARLARQAQLLHRHHRRPDDPAPGPAVLRRPHRRPDHRTQGQPLGMVSQPEAVAEVIEAAAR